jgi:hypothetical protein
VLTGQIFVDNKPPYIDLADERRTMTEAEALAQYASDQPAGFSRSASQESAA